MLWFVAVPIALFILLAVGGWLLDRRKRRRETARRIAEVQRAMRVVSASIGLALLPAMQKAVEAYAKAAASFEELNRILASTPSDD